jgi:hypothetical protein
VIGSNGFDVGSIRIEVGQRKIEAGPTIFDISLNWFRILIIFKAFLMLAEVGRAYPDHFKT